MAVLLTEPKIQFFDDDGNPLSGGKIYTYEAGTTTPKASYTDSGALTSNANPVVLDSAGRASIWINGSYKIVVKTSADVTIYTTDNITSFNTASSTINDLLPSQSGNSGKYLTTDGTNTSWSAISVSSIVSSFTNKILSGLDIAINATDSVNDVDVAAGSCVSDDGTTVMTVGSTITKRLDASWAVGTNQGGVDTGSVSDAIWYVWIINRTDTAVTDVLLSLSASAPTMPSSYTKKKKIGAVQRKAGTIAGGDVTFNGRYKSAEQAITAAGLVTLPHALGAIPAVPPTVALICKIAANNYSIGDIVSLTTGALGNVPASSNSGVTCTPDATNLVIRYASSADPYAMLVINKTTGVMEYADYASYRTIFYAQL